MTYKKCSGCKIDLHISSFNKKGSSIQPQCKECNKVSSKKYYLLKKKHHINKVSFYKKNRIKELYGRRYEYLRDKKCKLCPISNPLALEFDHRDRKTKHMDVTAMIRNGHSWNNILKEIEKCDILCANCHAIKTATEFNTYPYQLYISNGSVA